jgi:hypothetical protein
LGEKKNKKKFFYSYIKKQSRKKMSETCHYRRKSYKHSKSCRSRSCSPERKCGFSHEQKEALACVTNETRKLAMNQACIASSEAIRTAEDLCCFREDVNCRFCEVERQFCIRDDAIRRALYRSECAERMAADVLIRVQRLEKLLAVEAVAPGPVNDVKLLADRLVANDIAAAADLAVDDGCKAPLVRASSPLLRDAVAPFDPLARRAAWAANSPVTPAAVAACTGVAPAVPMYGGVGCAAGGCGLGPRRFY